MNTSMPNKSEIRTNLAPAPIGPYAQAILFGQLLLVSGQIALDPESGTLRQGSLAEEIQQVIHNLDAVLTAGDSSRSQLLKVTIFLKDMNDFPEVNRLWGEYLAGTVYPARETVEVSRLPKDVRLEISAIAGISA